MPSDEDYILERRTDRIYFSKEFPVAASGSSRPGRFVYRVLEADKRNSFAEIKGEVVIRVTSGGRQQIKALFYAEDRRIQTLTLQRFSTGTDRPHKDTQFSLKGDEIEKLLELASLIRTAEFTGQDRVRIDEADLEQFALTPAAARRLAKSNLDLIIEIAEHDVTKRDIVAIAYRRNELIRFRRMLHDPTFFDSERTRLKVKKAEAVWQRFFESNTWIFGYGLFYVFTSSLTDKKLEQIVAGYSVRSTGKRADALLRTRGRISSLCFVEIKTHETPLIEHQMYRSDVWPISRDLAGAVAQVQRTVQSAEENIGRRLDPRDEVGNPMGDSAYLFRSRSVVVIGSLGEFEVEDKVNEQKFSSFELFRRQLQEPEVITFDELYDRAKFIVESSEI